MNKVFYLLAVAIFCGCTSDSKTEKYQDERNNVVNVRDKVKELEIKDVLTSSIAGVSIIGDYLLISDYTSSSKFIHIFDKNTFKFIISAVSKGRGPGEIIRLGHVGVGDTDRVFYATDYGKQKVFRYDIDSILANPQYKPSVKVDISKKEVLIDSKCLNDSLSIGLVWIRNGKKVTKTSVAKLNMNTEEMQFMKYEHPAAIGSGKTFSVSIQDSLYVECYTDHDLMTICSFDGELQSNVYGPNWNTQPQKLQHFGNVSFHNNKIFVPYLGESPIITDKDGKMRQNSPTKFVVFDIDGNYIKTLEFGYQIMGTCFDPENNRLIMGLNDEMQFAYLDLDGIVD